MANGESCKYSFFNTLTHFSMRKAWNPSEVEERLNPDGSVQIIPVEVEEVVLSWDEEQPPTALHDIAHRAKVRKIFFIQKQFAITLS